MTTKVVFAGFGGQGVLLSGYAFAYAAMVEDKYVTYLPSYGAEQRGGTANCTVSVSNDEEIASPVASAPNAAIIMNHPSLMRFRNQVAPHGAFLLNSTLVQGTVERDDVEVFHVPATKIAEEMDSTRITNMVVLGGFIGMSHLVQLETVLSILTEIFPPSKHALIEINKRAIQAGYDYIMQQK